MKKLSAIIVIALFIVVSSTGLFGQTINAAEVKSIDAYCKTVDALLKKHKNAELVFADTAGMNDDKAKWRKFASVKALDKFRDKTETYSIAYNWRKNGKIVASNFTLFSGSGDWVKYINHYFRDDGTLARVDYDYRTFNGDFKVVRQRYFDRTGRQIKQSVKFLDLQSGKPKDASSGVMGDDANEMDFYKKTEKLPFARLVNSLK